MSEGKIEKIVPIWAVEAVSDWQCQHCGRDMNAGPLANTGHTDQPFPDNRRDAVVVDVADDLSRLLVICRWCAQDDDIRRRFELDE